MTDGGTFSGLRSRRRWLRWRLWWEIEFWRLAASNIPLDDKRVQAHFDEYMADWKRRHV